MEARPTAKPTWTLLKDKSPPYDSNSLYHALALTATFTRRFSRKVKVLPSTPTTVKRLQQLSTRPSPHYLEFNAIRRASRTNIRKVKAKLRIKHDQLIVNGLNTHPRKSRFTQNMCYYKFGDTKEAQMDTNVKTSGLQ